MSAPVAVAALDSIPLSCVRVTAPNLGVGVVTGSEGVFRLVGLPRTTLVLVFRRIGIVPDTVLLASHPAGRLGQLRVGGHWEYTIPSEVKH